ncbi:MAG: hypothetical protein O3C57_01700 [Verrucomicrobia bacterium]|nr:hypothetical protein [Verrucomicrobiota bacterium]
MNKGDIVRKRRIENRLRKALLQNGKMEHSLYEFELEEHLEYWYQGLKTDRDEFVFAVTENSGDVAMVLITDEKTVHINEQAKAKLFELWPLAYQTNMKQLIPMMAAELANDIIAVNGVKTVMPH